MKAKYIIMLIVCAVVTLSFGLVSASHQREKASGTEVNSVAGPAGGLTSEDPIK